MHARSEAGYATLITCEHGGNRIPARFLSCFAGREAVLQSHRGYDAGALLLARRMARALHAPLVASTISRLLIELNRSPRHPYLYSEFTRHLDVEAREEILQRYYLPYRCDVESNIARAAGRGRLAVHISSHSFTPELHGDVRNADIGLLYDPARASEKEFCATWKEALRRCGEGLGVRLNYPYRGNSDGLTRYLRRRFGQDRYIGVELEINQKYFLHDRRRWQRLAQAVVASLQDALLYR